MVSHAAVSEAGLEVLLALATIADAIGIPVEALLALAMTADALPE